MRKEFTILSRICFYSRRRIFDEHGIEVQPISDIKIDGMEPNEFKINATYELNDGKYTLETEENEEKRAKEFNVTNNTLNWSKDDTKRNRGY